MIKLRRIEGKWILFNDTVSEHSSLFAVSESITDLMTQVIKQTTEFTELEKKKINEIKRRKENARITN